MKSRFLATLVAVVTLLNVTCLSAQTPAANARASTHGAQIREVLGDDAADFWIYEDVDAGIAESKRTGKPLLVSIR